MHLRLFIILLLFGINEIYCQQSIDYIDKAQGLFKTDIDEFINVLNEGLIYYAEQNDLEKEILCANGLSSAYWKIENFQQSNLFAIKGYNLAKENLSKDKEAYRNSIHNLSVFANLKGNYQQSIRLLKETISLDSEMVDNNLFKHKSDYNRYIVSLKNLGDAYFSVGDYYESKRHYTKALSLAEKMLGPKNSKVSECYILLSINAEEFNQDSLRIDYLAKAEKRVEVFKLSEPNTYYQQKYQIHHQLAEYYYKVNNEQLFFDNISKAIKFGKKSFGEESVYKSYLLQGQWYLKNNDYKQSIQHFENAKTGLELVYEGFDYHPAKASAISHIGKTLAAEGKYIKALEKFQVALGQFDKDLNKDDFLLTINHKKAILSPDILAVLIEKGITLNKLYNRSKEKKYLLAEVENYEAAVFLLNKIRQQYLDHGSKEIITSSAISLFDNYMDAAHALYLLEDSQENYARLLNVAENSKAIILLESMNELNALGIGGVPDSLIQQEKEIKVEIAFLEKRLVDIDQTEKERIQLILSQLYSLKNQYGLLKDNLESKYPKYFKSKYKTELATLESIRKKLKTDKIHLLEYFVSENNIYILNISKNQNKAFKVPFDENLALAIETINTQISNPPKSENAQHDFASFSAAAKLLFDSLIGNSIENNSTEELVIVPDGLLSYLPFEVLLTKAPSEKTINYSIDNLDYLLEEYALSYEYSASLFVQNKYKPNKKLKDFIGFAPSFSGTAISLNRSCSEEDLSELVCSVEEVQKINVITNGEIFINEAANIKSFSENIADYKIIHLATHACVDKKNPNNNKIYFGEEYISGHELYNLDLNADLSVLSACNTGGGTLVEGEGVMSISRSFIQAGSKSVLMSLWSVDDCTTSTIMENYYKNLYQGQQKNNALQAAKLEFIKNANKLNSHPFYWAPFVQIGSIDAIEINKVLPFRLIPLFILLLLASLYLLRRKNKS